MALSGTITQNVNARWRLSVEWTGVQSISGNYTDITAKMYWQSLDGYGAVYSTASKAGSTYVNGWNNFTSTAGLSANQKKLVDTTTYRVNHNADGTGSVVIDGYFDIEVTLNGTYYGRVDMTAQTFTLNTIPRASTMSNDADWNAGSNKTVSINRSSSSFTHTVKFSVNGVLIATNTGVTTSTSSAFTVAENTSIFNQLNTGATQDTLIELLTYSGTTLVGTSSKTGTVTAPIASTLSGAFDDYVYTDQLIDFPITRAISSFTHTVTITLGTFTKSFTAVEGSVGWTPSVAEENSLTAQFPSSLIGTGSVSVTTFYGTEQVRTASTKVLKFTVRNANPTFADTQVSYADVLATATAITGNAQYAIQGFSTVRAYVNTVATGKKSATIVKYVITVNGQEKQLTGVGNQTFLPITASTNQTLTFTVVDSRGLETVVTKTVLVIPHAEPVLNLTLLRTNKFENTTTLTTSGSFSPLHVASVIKNAVNTLQYRYKLKTSGTWGSWTTIGFTTGVATFTGTNVVLNLDNLNAYDFEVKISDKIMTNTNPISVGAGQPIVFIDSTKKSVGVNKFPTGIGTFEVEGTGSFSKGILTNSSGVNTRNNLVQFYNAGATTGTLVVKIGSTPNIMLDADISIQAYNSVEKIHVRGYTYTTTSAWHMPKASVLSGSGKNINVRFATDATGARVILIGNTNTVWGEYLHATVNRISAGYGSTDAMLEPWSISVVTSETTFTGITANVAYNAITADPSGITVLDRLRINSVADTSAVSTDHGLTIGNDLTGSSIKIDANEISSFSNSAIAELHVNPDGGRVVFQNNAVGGNVVIEGGKIALTNAKQANGYNITTIRDGYVNHDGHMLIQNVVGTVVLSNTSSGYVDITFPTAFEGVPIWILAISINAQSFAFMNAIYSPTATGCRVYARQVDAGLSTLNLQVQVVACGRKG